MANMDPGVVFSNPDLIDLVYVERNTQSVNVGGIGSVSSEVLPFYAVVTQAQGDQLKRGADGEVIGGSIVVSTRFRLLAGAGGITADIVRWQGRRFTVRDVLPYTNFGAGFSFAICDLIPLSG